ncbi:hypothetical protein K461DRAFT_266122 [Myriangium duriaei CBS 260.36]|uniref:Uncharacterized protein n=1 Tax=Myriangium duriaei CBS 260.36 TaxID=1168546 RepID=A0A9P4J3G4_9PEZI|nr:hypothetical protein K461DRAFT_266122 [Myriangium duriaei CBS 260.36]
MLGTKRRALTPMDESHEEKRIMLEMVSFPGEVLPAAMIDETPAAEVSTAINVAINPTPWLPPEIMNHIFRDLAHHDDFEILHKVQYWHLGSNDDCQSAVITRQVKQLDEYGDCDLFLEGLSQVPELSGMFLSEVLPTIIFAPPSPQALMNLSRFIKHKTRSQDPQRRMDLQVRICFTDGFVSSRKPRGKAEVEWKAADRGTIRNERLAAFAEFKTWPRRDESHGQAANYREYVRDWMQAATHLPQGTTIYVDTIHLWIDFKELFLLSEVTGFRTLDLRFMFSGFPSDFNGLLKCFSRVFAALTINSIIGFRFTCGGCGHSGYKSYESQLPKWGGRMLPELPSNADIRGSGEALICGIVPAWSFSTYEQDWVPNEVL